MHHQFTSLLIILCAFHFPHTLRRNDLLPFHCRSVIRTDDREEQSAHGEMKQSEGARMDRDADMQPEDTCTLINYELFCNDIYVCDWA